MNPILKNVLAVLAGIATGWIVNMGLIILSPSIIPFPEGMIPGDMESLEAHVHLFTPKHFIMPFLAHALGTLAGAFVTTKIAATHQLKLALLIAAFFLLGGIMMVVQLPGSPMWFNVLDLVLAYIPMGYLGWKLAAKKES